jgi:hypothetical protein
VSCWNLVSSGSEIESLTVFDTMLQTAADPAQALTFQYASSAFNNHFFLHGLVSRLPPRVNTFVENTSAELAFSPPCYRPFFSFGQLLPLLHSPFDPVVSSSLLLN